MVHPRSLALCVSVSLTESFYFSFSLLIAVSDGLSCTFTGWDDLFSLSIVQQDIKRPWRVIYSSKKREREKVWWKQVSRMKKSHSFNCSMVSFLLWVNWISLPHCTLYLTKCIHFLAVFVLFFTRHTGRAYMHMCGHVLCVTRTISSLVCLPVWVSIRLWRLLLSLLRWSATKRIRGRSKKDTRGASVTRDRHRKSQAERVSTRR